MTGESLLTLEELLPCVKGTDVFARGKIFFTMVATDSRQVKKQGLFVPLIGTAQDGHDYIPQALKKGASAVFIASSSYSERKDYYEQLAEKYPAVCFVSVKNTLTALQQAAALYVSHFPRLARIGVTGSSGKTTTKEIAAAILSRKYNVVTNEGNLNSETGLPLSVFKIREEHEVGIFEMGMNRVGEMAEIASVLKPQYAIITNIGTAHIGILGSREAIAEEKSQIFNYFTKESVAVIPADDDFAQFLARKAKGEKIFFGENVPTSTVRFVRDMGLDGTEFSIAGQKGVLKLPGMHNYRNMLAAIALAQSMGLSASEVIAGVSKLKAVFGRTEIRSGTYTIVQDCYNANPDSMEKAIGLISSLETTKRKILVLGDMLELGSGSKRAHSSIGTKAAKSGANAVVFIGNDMKSAFTAASKYDVKCKFTYCEGSDEKAIKAAVSAIKKTARAGDIILLKASRGMELERITAVLEGKA